MKTSPCSARGWNQHPEAAETPSHANGLPRVGNQRGTGGMFKVSSPVTDTRDTHPSPKCHKCCRNCHSRPTLGTQRSAHITARREDKMSCSVIVPTAPSSSKKQHDRDTHHSQGPFVHGPPAERLSSPPRLLNQLSPSGDRRGHPRASQQGPTGNSVHATAKAGDAPPLPTFCRCHREFQEASLPRCWKEPKVPRAGAAHSRCSVKSGPITGTSLGDSSGDGTAPHPGMEGGLPAPPDHPLPHQPRRAMGSVPAS